MPSSGSRAAGELLNSLNASSKRKPPGRVTSWQTPQKPGSVSWKKCLASV